MASRHFSFLMMARARVVIPRSTNFVPIVHMSIRNMLTQVTTCHIALSCIANPPLMHCNRCFLHSSASMPRWSAPAHTHCNGSTADIRLHSVRFLLARRQTGYTHWRANFAGYY